MCDRNWLPSPSPCEAPFTRPAMSTNSTTAGIFFLGLTMALSVSRRGSGTSTTPTFGVSAFQIQFGSTDVLTAGDELDVLVAMNPAALTVNLRDLRMGGTVVADLAAFNERNLLKAGYHANPLEDDTLAPYQVLKLDITKLTADAVQEFGLSS